MFQTMMMLDLEQQLKKKALKVIDVREIDEYQSGHIENAIHIPISNFVASLEKAKLDKKETYHIVCFSGSRSLSASQYLSQIGYNVVNVMGGMSMYRGELK